MSAAQATAADDGNSIAQKAYVHCTCCGVQEQGRQTLSAPDYLHAVTLNFLNKIVLFLPTSVPGSLFAFTRTVLSWFDLRRFKWRRFFSRKLANVMKKL